MRLISEGFGRDPLAAGASRSVSPSRMSLHSLTHSLQMYTDGPETSRATSSWPRPQNEHRIGGGVAMRFFMGGCVLDSGKELAVPGVRDRLIQRRFSMISSTRPYCFASSDVIQWLRSVSFAICSIDRPVCLARIWFNWSRVLSISLVAISTSVAWPDAPPSTWWIMTLAFG